MKLTPSIAAKKSCLECVGKERMEAVNCTDVSCAFYPHRPRQKGRVSVKAIRKFCLQCTCGDQEYVRNCPTTKCLCFPFRMGRNPNFTMTDQERARRTALFSKSLGIAAQKTP